LAGVAEETRSEALGPAQTFESNDVRILGFWVIQFNKEWGLDSAVVKSRIFQAVWAEDSGVLFETQRAWECAPSLLPRILVRLPSCQFLADENLSTLGLTNRTKSFHESRISSL